MEKEDILVLYMIILASVGDIAYNDIETLIHGSTTLARERCCVSEYAV